MPIRTRTADPPLSSHLPLKADVLMILLALRDGEQHGYAIMRDALARSEGTVRLQAGALYRVLKRLLDNGLVEETERSGAPTAEDERRRYYRLSRLGADVLDAELRRLARLIGGPRAASARRRPRPA